MDQTGDPPVPDPDRLRRSGGRGVRKFRRMRRRAEPREDVTKLFTMETKPEKNYGSIYENEPVKPKDANVFSDGSTRVDFVLAWEEPLTLSTDQCENVNPNHRKWRDKFLRKLQYFGLLMEQKMVIQEKSRVCFVLLSAPWRVLCYYGEEISLRVPLQVGSTSIINWSEQFLTRLSLPSILSQDVPNPPADFYTCQFRTNKLQRLMFDLSSICRFLGNEEKETFFKTTQRHQVVYEILARTPYGVVKRGEVGIDRLLSEGVFSAAYPLHEGDFELPNPPVPPQSLGLRQILHRYWACWSCWRRYQPLDHIREYFGEKIALYFAWIGFYTAWLLPASVFGIFIFIVGIWIMITDVPAKEVCESGDQWVMCPLCNICSYWNYSSICISYKVGILFDNGGTVFFSVFMSLWAVSFLEYWKRTCYALSHRWDCSEFQDIEERPRPEFATMAPMTTRNPVTGAEEPYFPEGQRLNRRVMGFMVILLMIVVVLMFLIAIIVYRTILKIIIYKSENSFVSFSAGRIASLSGSVLNLVVILMLSRVYTSLAQILTRWEMHRTQSKYEDMFILKVFIFQFINFYSSPIYIAFFKGRFNGFPGHYYTLFGVRNEDCGVGGCLTELAQELLVIMVGKQLINNIQEFIAPKLKAWWKKKKNPCVRKVKEEEARIGMSGEEKDQEGVAKVPPWEADYELLVCEGLFNEYLEMVIQFGFITIFVAAFPLAPFFALVNNWVEIRLDAQKFVTEYRRPVIERAQDIGIWFPIMQFISHIAVLTNAFLIAFTSSFLPRLYYRYTRDDTLKGYINFTLSVSPKNFSEQACRYRALRDENGNYLPDYFHLLAVRLTFVIVFEHVVFFISRFIDLMVPDIPEEVEIKMKREHYMAKEALAENQSFAMPIFPEEQLFRSRDLKQHGFMPSPLLCRDPPPQILVGIHEESEKADS